MGGHPLILGTLTVSSQFVQHGPLGIGGVLSVGDVPACLRHSKLRAQCLKPTTLLAALLLRENVPRSLCGGSFLLCSGFKSIYSSILSPVVSLIITPLCLSVQEETSRSFPGLQEQRHSPQTPPQLFLPSLLWLPQAGPALHHRVRGMTLSV